jgi:protocatechuate 3,4-dioxygenase beta subunit
VNRYRWVVLGLVVLCGFALFFLVARDTPAPNAKVLPSRAAAVQGTSAMQGSVRVLAPAADSNLADVVPNPARIFLEGVVVDDASGQPIAGASVALHHGRLAEGLTQIATRRDSAPQRTDARGRFRFGPLRAATHGIGVQAKGYLPQAKQSVDPQDRIEMRMIRGGTSLRGKVSDLTGGTVPGARLVFGAVGEDESMTYARPRWTAIADANGEYRIDLAPGTYETVAAHPDYCSDRDIVRVEEMPLVRDFDLAPAAQISGIVRELGTGLPVVAANVYVRPSTSGYSQGIDVQGQSDDQGKFEIEGVEPGALVIYAAAPELASATPLTLHVAPGEHARGLELWLDSAGTLEGQVVVKNGQEKPTPVVGAVVSGLSTSDQRYYVADAPSDASGRFRITGVLPTTLTLQTVANNLAPFLSPEPVEVRSGTTRVEVTMTRGLTIRGRVEPAQVAQIHLEMALNGQNWGQMQSVQANGMARSRSDSDGSFVVNGVAPAALRLVAQTEDGRTGFVELDVRDSMESVVVQLEDSAPVEGTVHDESGRPLSVRIDMRRANDALAALRLNNLLGLGGIRSDASGRFAWRGLSSGTYTLHLYDEHGEALPVRAAGAKNEKFQSQLSVHLPKDRRGAALSLIAQAGRTELSGTVVDDEGSPLAQALVSVEENAGAAAMRMPSKARRVLTDESGRFKVGGLLAHATYRVRAHALELARHSEVMTVPVGDLKIALVRSGELNVAFPADLDLGDACQIAMHGPTVRHVRCRSGEQIRITDLLPGEYAVQVQTDFGYAKLKVAVQSGEQTITPTLEPWGRIEAILVDAEEKPLALTPVWLQTLGEDGKSDAAGLFATFLGTAPRSDAAGKLVIDKALAGKATLIVLDRHAAIARKTQGVSVVVRNGETTDMGIVRVARGETNSTRVSPPVASNH